MKLIEITDNLKRELYINTSNNNFIPTSIPTKSLKHCYSISYIQHFNSRLEYN
nr:MAG TPA: hypothetical protein [Caudoviricetes sp.]